VENRGARRFVSVYGFPILAYISCLAGDYFEAGLLIFIRERGKEIPLVALSLFLSLSSSCFPKVELREEGREEIDFSGLETQFALFRNDGAPRRRAAIPHARRVQRRRRRGGVSVSVHAGRMHVRAPSACAIRETFKLGNLPNGQMGAMGG